MDVGILVGYSGTSKAYRVSSTGLVEISCIVQFDESKGSQEEGSLQDNDVNDVPWEMLLEGCPLEKWGQKKQMMILTPLLYLLPAAPMINLKNQVHHKVLYDLNHQIQDDISVAPYLAI